MATLEKKPRKQRSDAGKKKGFVDERLGTAPAAVIDAAVAAMVEVDPNEKVFGFPVADGFSKIMVFPAPGDGNNLTFMTLRLGDFTPLTIAKGKLHVLPNCLVGLIEATVVESVEDDLSDPRKPVRHKNILKTRFPHSPRVPATKEEFVAYYTQQHKLEHPNNHRNRTSAGAATLG